MIYTANIMIDASIDIEAELYQILSEEIRKEIDREVSTPQIVEEDTGLLK